jgi:NifU-like protein involved in Fe-S cluster formation
MFKQMVDHILWFMMGSGVLLGLVGLWVAIYYFSRPHLENPDGKAVVTGTCGDTMEIGLEFRGNRVVKSTDWTNGCAYSLTCVHAAAALAKGKTPDELLDIDAERIQASIGGLPKDHMHCATLAAETLDAALHDYMLKQSGKHPADAGEVES